MPQAIPPAASDAQPLVVPIPYPAQRSPAPLPVPTVGAGRETGVQATPTPDAPPDPSVLDVAAQATALLPAHHTDLERASEWHQYAIVATLNPSTATISGTARVLARNHTSTPLHQLYFHLYPNHPDFGSGSLWVDDHVLVDEQPVAVHTEQDDTLLRLDLPGPLVPGESATVEMAFRAHTPQNSSRRAYGAFNQQDGVWALASFYPVLAYVTDAGWDRRAISSRGDLAVTATALYDVRLDVPAGWHLVTTGVRVGDGSNGASDGPGSSEHTGYRRERFVSGPQRDFFVAAVQGLEQSSTVVDGTRVTTWYQPGNHTSGQESLQVAAQALQIFNTAYGAYPYTELDVVQAALTTFLGVEYPGVVLMEQGLYVGNATNLETILAHEVSHQWWYNVVGNDVQSEAWLDEGLASFSQIIYYEAQGDQAQAASEVQHFRRQYQRAVNNNLDGPLNRPSGEFRGSYFSLVYAKSALFFVALRDALGDEIFSQFLQDYYRTYRYQQATGSDLIASVEETCGCNVHDLYTTWVIGPSP
jgi:hypothetical protein